MGIQNETIKVGGWKVEPELLKIRNGPTTHRLEPQAMRLLVFLVGEAPRVVSREEIFEAVWDGRSVVDETLTRSVYLLRQALGDDAKKPNFIETIPTKGYRLIAVVDRGSASARLAVMPDLAPQTTTSARRLWLLLALLVTTVVAVLLPRLWRDVEMATSGDTDRRQSRPTIAVLPFDNLSGDAEDLYLADGLTEELIHQLAGIAGLKVVSRFELPRWAPPLPA